MVAQLQPNLFDLEQPSRLWPSKFAKKLLTQESRAVETDIEFSVHEFNVCLHRLPPTLNWRTLREQETPGRE